MKLSALLLLLVIAGTALGYFIWYKPTIIKKKADVKPHPVSKSITPTLSRLQAKAAAAKEFVKANNYYASYCFLVDMHVAPGKQRFFVYNLKKDSVETAGLVTHGSGSDKGGDELSFSNTISSNATSLGKYKIGKPYMGKFGLASKLYGLEKTNSNAFSRFVVLHSHSCVPNEEVYPLSICESWGCPTVAPAFLEQLKTKIDNAGKPVLLWIYY